MKYVADMQYNLFANFLYSVDIRKVDEYLDENRATRANEQNRAVLNVSWERLADIATDLETVRGVRDE